MRSLMQHDGQPNKPFHLTTSGYNPHRRTLFIWEGVTNYLAEGIVDETLRWCASAPAGSKALFTRIHARVVDEPGAFEGTNRLFAILDTSYERWTFGLDPSGLPSFVAQRGLRLEADVGASDYRARYFGRRADRMRGDEFYRIAVARVAEASGNPRDAAQQGPSS
jgi:O-methyltransferase involved in polyketide biosynthesis